MLMPQAMMNCRFNKNAECHSESELHSVMFYSCKLKVGGTHGFWYPQLLIFKPVFRVSEFYKARGRAEGIAENPRALAALWAFHALLAELFHAGFRAHEVHIALVEITAF